MGGRRWEKGETEKLPSRVKEASDVRTTLLSDKLLGHGWYHTSIYRKVT